jgi:hypothetical protein
MMTEVTASIVREICELNAKSRRENSDWFIGAVADVENYLFKELKIPRDYRWCLHRRATTAKEAQAIVMGFWNIGFRESRGAGAALDQSAVHVYAYAWPPAVTAATARVL